MCSFRSRVSCFFVAFALSMAAFPVASPAQGLKIDLGDITAGGDGTGTADPAVVGINPDTGSLDTAFLDAPHRLDVS